LSLSLFSAYALAASSFRAMRSGSFQQGMQRLSVESAVVWRISAPQILQFVLAAIS
jgi:hypothetical protein